MVGQGWPAVATRQEMLEEAIEVIRALHTGEPVNHHGEYFRVESARIWELPEGGVPIGVAVSGDASTVRFAPLADHLIAVEHTADLVGTWTATEGAPSVPGKGGAIGEVPICWAPDEKAAVERAHEQFRWFAGGWSVNADLPTTAGFVAATTFVRPEATVVSPDTPDARAATDRYASA